MRRLLMVVGLSALPAIAKAQAIRGTAVDAGGKPLAGVVVFMLDSRDSVAARALTNERGEFRVSAIAPGAYRLRTMRIGYRPSTTGPLQLAAQQEIQHSLALAGVPFSLDTIRVTGRNACRAPTDSAAAVFALWEQARAALTATQLTSGGRGVNATVVTYDRTLAPARDRVISQRSTVVTGFTSGLWRSRSAELLRSGGYVVPATDGSTIYYAPDLTVLLSEGFLEDHCFRVAPATDARRVGMAFEPTRSRRDVSGIRGTLWFDRASAELRRLEFRYTNTTPEQEAGDAGGRVDFARTATGAWLISSWQIRMPLIQERQRRVGGFSTVEQHLREIRVEGGELALLTRNRDTLWSRAPLALAGRLMDSTTGMPLAGARVALRGAGLEGQSDSLGRFRIVGVLPGEYTLDIRPRTYSSIGASYSRSFAFTDSSSVAVLRVPSAQQIAASGCPVSRDGVVGGIVRLAGDTAAPRNVRVSADWDEATQTGRRFGGTEARADANGAFRLCGLPLDAVVTIRAQNDSSTTEAQDVRIPLSERFATVEIVLNRRVDRGTLRGTVLSDVDGRPIAGAEVAIGELTRSTRASDAGTFRIPDLPAGTWLVTIRSVGYHASSVAVNIVAGQATERAILLSKVVVLDTVSVRAEGLIASFEENRRLGLGHFLTRTDIEKLNGRPLSDAFNQMQGASVARAGNAAFVMSRRAPASIATLAGQPNASMWCPADGGNAAFRAQCGCYPKVWLDNQLLNPTQPNEPIDISQFDPNSIEAVEWYSGPSQTPLKYSTLNSTCGVLVIHTRRPK